MWSADWAKMRVPLGYNGTRMLEDNLLELRKLTAEDAEAFWTLRVQALRDHPEAFGMSYEEALAQPMSDLVERFRGDLAKPDNFVVGAFDSSRLVGTVAFRRESMSKVRHKGMFWGVYVAPEMRGQGLGEALVRRAIKYAAALPGLEQIVLSVAKSSTVARKIYVSLGFEAFAYEPRALKIGDRYVDEEHMKLQLP